MLTHRDIEANPKKCKAILEMKSPTSIKEQDFLYALAKKSLPLFALLKKKQDFSWSKECEAAFQDFKRYLSTPPILSKLELREQLVLYLSIAKLAVGPILIRETKKVRNWCISQAKHCKELRSYTISWRRLFWLYF